VAGAIGKGGDDGDDFGKSDDAKEPPGVAQGAA
jgi:hypothetical protein